MHLFGRRPRADSHGRFHLSCDEMAELYRGFHSALADTYWETASNHKICTDAMEAIRTTHISKKSGRFLRNFTALVREVYSHAHYNVHELLYEERDDIRKGYWETIKGLLEIVLKRADHIWTTPCAEKLSLLLQFSALFSLYKDVGEEDFIQRIYTLAVEYMQSHKNKGRNKADEDKMFDYFDQIQLVFRMRKEARRGSVTSDRRPPPRPRSSKHNYAPEVPRMEHRESRLATKEELDDFFDKIMKEQQKQRRSRMTPVTVEEDEIESPQLEMWVTSSSHDENANLHSEVKENHLSVKEPKGSRDRSSSPSRRRGSFVHLPEIMNVIKKLNPVSHHQKAEEPPPEMAEFDYKAEFEKRLGKRNSTTSTGSVVVDLPVITKPNPMDKVYSYRRPALFNDQAPLRRGISESRTEEVQEEKFLVPPPKPPRSYSPRTMERKIVEAVVSGSPV